MNNSILRIIGLLIALLSFSFGFHADAAESVRGDDKLRIICFGAHPDDSELHVSGVAAMWAAKGHHVKFVSLTSGDIGHWNTAGGALAQRRRDEVSKAAELLGITVQVLDIHDGELMPTLENRKTVIRLIREWKADVVMSHRPIDYHPDHRYAGVLVQDAAFMVQVPFMTDVPPLEKNPVFLYLPDRFTKPNPFKAAIAIAIDSTIEKKMDALALMESQFLEGGALGHVGLLPKDASKKPERVSEVRQMHSDRFQAVANRFRPELIDWYGAERGNKIKYAEAFEICEYGRQPDREELKKLFPFFD